MLIISYDYRWIHIVGYTVCITFYTLHLNLLEVQEDPANQWILDVLSVLSLHDHQGLPYHPEVLAAPENIIGSCFRIWKNLKFTWIIIKWNRKLYHNYIALWGKVCKVLTTSPLFPAAPGGPTGPLEPWEKWIKSIRDLLGVFLFPGSSMATF